MKKIAVEMAARERRRSIWMVVLYSFIGVIALTGIFYTLFAFGVLTFKTPSINFDIWNVGIISSVASFFETIHKAFSDMKSSIAPYRIIIMVCTMVLFYYTIGEILSQRRRKV